MSLSDKLCLPASWTSGSMLTPVHECGPTACLPVWRAASESIGIARMSKRHHDTSCSQLIPKHVCLYSGDLARFFGFLWCFVQGLHFSVS